MHRIEVGVAMKPMAGQARSADRHLVRRGVDRVLIAALDGVGHGVEAERAALEAVRTLDEAPMDSLVDLVTRCHARLRATRGVVMSVALLDLEQGTLTWLGIGNVTGALLRRNGAVLMDESLLLRGGVVGHRLPILQSESLKLAPGDIVVFATDGVKDAFELDRWPVSGPQRLAEAILTRYDKGTDDALVLAVRYRGAGS